MGKVSNYRSCCSVCKAASFYLPKMNILVNNNSHEIDGTPSVADLLAHVNVVARRGIAVAVNSTVVSVADWENHLLQDNDKVMIIKATQGG
jgi:sulfur carrier protein